MSYEDACDRCNQRLEDCECEPGFPSLGFDPETVYGNKKTAIVEKPRIFYAMKFKLDRHIDHLSLRHTKMQCVEDFEASFGQVMSPEYLSGWEAVKVMVVEL